MTLYDATCGRLFATLYDGAFRRTEEMGLRKLRRDLLGEASGATLEIGAGTGLNLDHYTAKVTSLVLAEPSVHMAAKLHPKLDANTHVTSVIDAPGECLPHEDGIFDTVVATLVLCTAPEPAKVLEEVARVLRPGGRFLFLEHVRSSDPSLARWQDRLAGPWKFFCDGCVCNRDTERAIAGSPLSIARMGESELPNLGPLVRPLIFGVATR